jgi:uncharacterized protein
MSKETILIAGGSGLVGQALIRHIDRTKYDIIVLTRNSSYSRNGIQYINWDTQTQKIDLDIVPHHMINLAGAGIADKLWTRSRRKELIDSRVFSAQTIASFVKSSIQKPKTYISASAIGFYGDRGNELLIETSTKGEGFMAECCALWEQAAYKTGLLCDRHTILRIGIVLSTKDGALPKMLMTKGIGVYNYFGDGSQYYSWVHIDDLCRMILFSIENPKIEGIYNAVAPQSMQHKLFMKEVMKAMNSYGVLVPAPAFALKLAMGEMADVVLNSNRVSAEKWKDTGFELEHDDLANAIQDLESRSV